MANSAHADWNAVLIIYKSKDASEKIIDWERTCIFHWTQFLEKHTKANIPQDLQAQYRKLYQQYRTAKSFAKSKTKFLAILAWWMSSGAATEQRLPILDLTNSCWRWRVHDIPSICINRLSRRRCNFSLRLSPMLVSGRHWWRKLDDGQWESTDFLAPVSIFVDPSLDTCKASKEGTDKNWDIFEFRSDRPKMNECICLNRIET